MSGRLKLITFPPQTRKLSSSRDRCMVLQESTINYSLSNRHSDIDIMCESGNLTFNDECRKRSAQSGLYIRMKTMNWSDWHYILAAFIYLFVNNPRKEEDTVISARGYFSSKMHIHTTSYIWTFSIFITLKDTLLPKTLFFFWARACV